MDTPFKPQQVDRQGAIRHITPSAVQEARKAGKRWKLVCSPVKDAAGVHGRVAPELVGADSPLFGVEGATSIIQFETDVLGKLTILEENPGPHTTAYGNLADFLSAIND